MSNRRLSIRGQLLILGGGVVLLAVSVSLLESRLLAVAGSTLVLAAMALGYRKAVLSLETLVERTSEVVRGERDHIEVSGPSELTEMAARLDDALHQARDREARARDDSRDEDAAAEAAAVVNPRGLVVEDQPETRQLVAQLAQTQRIEAVGRLAGGIAHDFNNVLTVILGETQMGLRRVSKDDPLAETLEEIKAAGDRAAALTRQLLMFSRKQLVEPRVFDMNDAVRGMDSMMRRLIGEDLALRTTFAPIALPILTDPGQFEQALVNLVVNARAAMAHGGELTITSGTATFDEEFVRSNLGAREGEYVRLEVSDTGAGMTEEVQALIFEPFFTTKPSGEGTGLGLSQVYGIVKKADGYITVDSAPGEGTTFKIYFPFMAQEELESRADAQATTVVASGHEAILLVEDDDRVRRTAKGMLEEAGYTVVAVCSGPDALRHLQEPGGHFDLLLTDVVMPEMGGREVAERVLEVRPGIRVLFATGYTDDVVLRRQLIDRDAELLNKPFTYESLARKVREILDSPIELSRSGGAET